MSDFFSEGNVSSSHPEDETTEDYIKKQVGLGYKVDIHESAAKVDFREAQADITDTSDYVAQGQTKTEFKNGQAMDELAIAAHAEEVRKARLKKRIGVELTPEEDALAAEMVPSKDLPKNNDSEDGVEVAA